MKTSLMAPISELFGMGHQSMNWHIYGLEDDNQKDFTLNMSVWRWNGVNYHVTNKDWLIFIV